MEIHRRKRVVKRRSSSKSKPKTESRWSDKKQDDELKGWLTMGAIIAGLVVGLGVVLYVVFGSSGDKSEKDQQAPPTPIVEEKWQGPLPKDVAENFTKATTHAERIKWVRDPDRVSALMLSFFDEGAGAKEKVVSVKRMGGVSTGNFLYERFQARLDNEKSRMLAVVFTDEGAKVDFECYARHGSATWSDLFAGVVKEASEVRGTLASGSFYLFEFADDKKWNSYLVTTPDYDGPIHVYAARGSETDKAMSRVGTGEVRVMLALRAVGDSYQKRQFEVTKLITTGWVK
jgi:hypothetical protein